ncbi:MAG: nucleoside hydrolase [Thermotogae bacterium]|nr:nucleoside hydrolase [Thermotogota bacterium]
MVYNIYHPVLQPPEGIGVERLILDCDPGHDDAIAILMAGLDEKLELLGITTVAGNSYLENTTMNALKVVEMAGLDVDVYAGCARPLLRDQIVAPEIHGSTGLEGAKLPTPKRQAEEKHAVDFIAEMVKAYPGEINLVATGPLTNIALFIIRYPDLVEKLKRIVMMAGGIAFGNVTPVAEFNVYADPEAANVVLRSSVEKVMAPLDVTHQAIMAAEEIERLRKTGSHILQTLADLLDFFRSTYLDLFDIDGAVLHDPCAVMYLIDPTIFECEDLYVEVELDGNLTYGQTVADIWKTMKMKPNVRLLKRIDRKAFFDRLFEDLEKLAVRK